MRIFRWWLVRAEYGDVHDLPPWAYDEVIGSRWQSGLLELRVKKLARRETELEEQVLELERELAVARGEIDEIDEPVGAAEAEVADDPAGEDEPGSGESADVVDAASADAPGSSGEHTNGDELGLSSVHTATDKHSGAAAPTPAEWLDASAPLRGRFRPRRPFRGPADAAGSWPEAHDAGDAAGR